MNKIFNHINKLRYQIDSNKIDLKYLFKSFQHINFITNEHDYFFDKMHDIKNIALRINISWISFLNLFY